MNTKKWLLALLVVSILCLPTIACALTIDADKETSDQVFTNLISSNGDLLSGVAIFEVANIWEKDAEISFTFDAINNNIDSYTSYIEVTSEKEFNTPYYAIENKTEDCKIVIDEYGLKPIKEDTKTNLCTYETEVIKSKIELKNVTEWVETKVIPAGYKGRVKMVAKYSSIAYASNNVMIDWKPELIVPDKILGVIPVDVKVTKDEWSWWNASWTYRDEIVINELMIDEDQTNFPVLVTIPSDFNYSRVLASGDDIRFVDSDDSTQLTFEKELLNTSGKSYYWVKMPVLNSTANKTIYMYYGNTTAVSSAEDKTATWNSGEYFAVMHFNELNGLDSSSNLNNVTTSSVDLYDSSQCMIGNCYNFNGSSVASRAKFESWISFIAAGINSGYAVEYITYIDTASAYPHAIYSTAWDIDVNNQMQVIAGGISTGSTTRFKNCAGISCTDLLGTTNINGTWTSVFNSFNNTGGVNNMTTYLNGTFEMTGTRNTPTLGNSSWQSIIGAGYDRSAGVSNYKNYYLGRADELRIHNGTRTEGWIKAESKNVFGLLTTFVQSDECAATITSIAQFNAYTTNNSIVCIKADLTFDPATANGLEVNATNLTLKCKNGAKINLNQSHVEGVYVNKDNFTIQDCEIYNQNQSYGFDRFGVMTLNDYTSVINCTIHGIKTDAIQFISNADYGVAYNNTIYNTSNGNGIMIGDYHTPSSPPDTFFNITQNTIYNTNTANVTGAAGIRVDAYTENSTIFNNTIYSNKYGIYITDDANYNNFTLNTIHDNTDHGIYITTEHAQLPNNNTFADNIIYNNWLGVYAGSGDNETFTNNWIYNNSYYEFLTDGDHDTITNLTIGWGTYKTSADYLQSGHAIRLKQETTLPAMLPAMENLSVGLNMTNTTGNKFINIKIYYNQTIFDDSNLTDESALKIWEHNGTDWIALTSSVDTTNNWVSSNITSFSDFTIAGVVDADADGYNASVDCNDSNAAIWVNVTGYVDTDLDGYGVNPSQQVCSNGTLPSGYVSDNTYLDCNNNNATIRPIQNSTTTTLTSNIVICNGVYSGAKINVNAINVNIDCNGSTLTIAKPNTEKAIKSWVYDGLIVKNCTITNYDYAVDVMNSSNSIFEYLTINSPINQGIFLHGNYITEMSNVTIRHNSVNGSSSYGLRIDAVNDLNITNNTITNNNEGIIIYTSDNLTLTNCIANNSVTNDAWFEQVTNSTITNLTLNSSGDYNFIVDANDNTNYTNIKLYGSPDWQMYFDNSVSNNYFKNIYVNNNQLNFTSVGRITFDSNIFSAPADPPLYSNISHYIEATNYTAAWFAVDMKYNDTDWSSTNITNESSIEFWRNNGSWTQDSVTSRNIDTINNWVSANFTSFSTFAPLGWASPCYDLDGDGFNGTDLPECGDYIDCDDGDDTIYPLVNDTNLSLSTNLTICNDYIYSNASIFVTAGDLIVDCDGTIADGENILNSYFFENYNNNNVTLKGCRIRDYDFGIYYYSADNSIVFNNTINDSQMAIGFSQSSQDQNISNNRINDAVGTAIQAYNCNDSYLRNNVINNATTGIDTSGDGWYVNNNTIEIVTYGIGMPYTLNSFVYNNTINNSETAIHLDNADDNEVYDNIIDSADYGIFVTNFTIGTPYFSIGNEIYENVISNIAEDGIFIDSQCNDTLVDENVISDVSDNGIYALDVGNVNITYNNINDTSDNGIRVYNSDSLLIDNNIISYSGESGIDLEDITNSVFSDNDMTLSTDYGIYISGSSNTNSLSGNTFEDNTIAYYFAGSSVSNTITDSGAFDNVTKYFVFNSSGENDLGSSVLIPTNISTTTLNGTFKGVQIEPYNNSYGSPLAYLEYGRYAKITLAQIGGYAYLTMHYEDTDYDSMVVDENTTTLFEENYGHWSEVPAQTLNTTDNIITANVTSFSGFGLFGTNYGNISINVTSPTNNHIFTYTINIPINFTFENATICNITLVTDGFTQIDENVNCSDHFYRFDAIGDKQYNLTLTGANMNGTSDITIPFKIERDTEAGTMTLGIVFLLLLGLSFLFVYLATIFSNSEHPFLKIFFIFIAVFLGFTDVNMALLGLREYAKIPAIEQVANTYHQIYIWIIIIMIVYFLIYLIKKLLESWTDKKTQFNDSKYMRRDR